MSIGVSMSTGRAYQLGSELIEREDVFLVSLIIYCDDLIELDNP